jgi:hypothetical protein
MQVTEQLGGFRLPDTIFRLSWQRPSGGEWLTAVFAVQKKYDTPALAVRLCHSAVWNLVEMSVEINLHELTEPFERCVLETERMETLGNSFKILKQKIY